jgi:hypothetical protein
MIGPVNWAKVFLRFGGKNPAAVGNFLADFTDISLDQQANP